MNENGNRGRPSGGNKIESAKSTALKDIKIDKNVSMKRSDVAAEEKNIYKCTCCGTQYSVQRGNFPVTNSLLYAANNGYLTTCRNCAEKYYYQLIGYYSGNEEHAIEHCCRLFDWYYNPEITAMIKSVPQEKNKISLYSTKMNLTNMRAKGTTYLDTVKDEYNNKISTTDDMSTTHNAILEGEGGEVPEYLEKDVIMFFGYGYTAEEYEYLYNQYGDWASRYECSTKAQEELFKNLSVAQLMIQKAQRSGGNKESTEAMKVFQELLGSANLKPSQSNDSALADQNTFGTLIKKWENTNPISEPDDEWKDVDGIHEYINTYFLGHLCNLVHVKNDHEEAYRREMEKYTVKPPEYEEDEAGETSLLDKFSDKGNKDDNA